MTLPAPLVVISGVRDHEFDQWLTSILTDVPEVARDLQAMIDWSVAIEHQIEHRLASHAVRRWELLASVAAIDLEVARVLEPHLDALDIISQAGDVDLAPVDADDRSSWGVFAAESPDLRLDAAGGASGWYVTGTKPWCSLAGSLSHALVTAYTGESTRRLFGVDLRGPGVHAAEGPWVARGLRRIVSAPVAFDSARAVPVGADDWYLHRQGFAWGGVGVSACWYGGAVGTARAIFDRTTQRADQIASAHLGAVDTALTAARAVLAETATFIDTGSISGEDARIIAHRARSVVVSAAEEVLTRAAHALGPGPLTTDETYARRTADLQLYLRQHHAERDDAALGQALLRRDRLPW